MKGEEIVYYEEKIINCRLMFRTSPSGKWRACDKARVTARLLEALQDNKSICLEDGK